MAQLRDATTSEILAHGDPRDLVIVADELGDGRVLWDDVGDIDLDALRTVNAEALEHLPDEARQVEQGRQDAARQLADQVADVAASAQDDQDTRPPIDVTATVTTAS